MHSRITAPRTRRGIALPSRDASQPGDASFQFVRASQVAEMVEMRRGTEGVLRQLVLLSVVAVSAAFRGSCQGGLAVPVAGARLQTRSSPSAPWPMQPRVNRGGTRRAATPVMTLADDLIAYGPALVPFALLWHTSHTAPPLSARGGFAPRRTRADADRLRSQLMLSPAWTILTGLTCNVADAQSSREFVAAWLASRSSLDPYSGGSQTLQQGAPAQLTPEDAALISKLQLRAKEVDDGAGRLFRVCTQVCARMGKRQKRVCVLPR
jgi:hypothetical protein